MRQLATSSCLFLFLYTALNLAGTAAEDPAFFCEHISSDSMSLRSFDERFLDVSKFNWTNFFPGGLTCIPPKTGQVDCCVTINGSAILDHPDLQPAREYGVSLGEYKVCGKLKLIKRSPLTARGQLSFNDHSSGWQKISENGKTLDACLQVPNTAVLYGCVALEKLDINPLNDKLHACPAVAAKIKVPVISIGLQCRYTLPTCFNISLPFGLNETDYDDEEVGEQISPGDAFKVNQKLEQLEERMQSITGKVEAIGEKVVTAEKKGKSGSSLRIGGVRKYQGKLAHERKERNRVPSRAVGKG